MFRGINTDSSSSEEERIEQEERDAQRASMTARIANLKYKLVSGGRHAKRTTNYEEGHKRLIRMYFGIAEENADGNIIEEEVLREFPDDKFERRFIMPRHLFMRFFKEATTPGTVCANFMKGLDAAGKWGLTSLHKMFAAFWEMA